jgi:hypothetical protein
MSNSRASGAQSGSMAALSAAGLLGLGAAPVFALMALWTVLLRQPGMLCTSMHDTWSLNGMTLMYALMSVFHAAPWLKLMSSRSMSS